MNIKDRLELRRIASHFLYNTDDLDPSEIVDFDDDLGDELEAAVNDRWQEWLKARKAGLPLGEFVTED